MINSEKNPQLESSEVQKQKPKAVLILGALWSWKTQFLNQLLPHVHVPYQIIVNDIGSINIDASRFGDNSVEWLEKWCICCDDSQSFQKVVEKYKNSPQVLFIEPSGIAGGGNLNNILQKAGYDIKVITLVDVEHFAQRTPAQKQIMESQIKVANIIWLTWIGKDEQPILDWINNLWKKSPVTIPNSSTDSEKIFYQDLVRNILDFSKKSENIPWKSEYSIVSNGGNNYKRLSLGWHIFWNTAEKNPLTSESFSPKRNISLGDLERIIQFFWNELIRAKWEIEGYEFDFVHGSLNIRNKKTTKNYFTLITESKIPKDLLTIIFPEIFTEDQSNTSIEKLVDDYHKYMRLEDEIAKLQWLLSWEQNHIYTISELESEKKLLWDSMKYPNPYIWLQYKLQAYKNSPKQITTIWDLKEHCKDPTYICHKRLQFLSNILKNEYKIDIFDENLENLEIEQVIQNAVINEISQNETHMQNWSFYEFYSINGETAKWENFNS